MLTQWYRADIFTTLNKRKWDGRWPYSLSEEESRYVDECYTFRRSDEELKVYFVADSCDVLTAMVRVSLSSQAGRKNPPSDGSPLQAIRALIRLGLPVE